MTIDRKSPTSLVPVSPAPLAEVVDAQLVPYIPTDSPFDVFRSACDERSRPTMVARLNAAARIIQAGADAESYPWAMLDHIAVLHVLTRLDAAQAAPATRNLTRAALRKMAKVLFGMRLMSVEERQRIDDVQPARGKRLPRGRSLTQRDMRKLFAACANDPTPAGRRDAALMAVMFGGGLRRAEAANLNVSDVLDGKLRVEGKGNTEAEQPVTPTVMDALRAWIDIRGDREETALFLVVNKYGRIMDRRLIGKAIAWKLARRAAQAGIEPLPDGHMVSPHDLRRSFGTGLLEAGEDLSTVAKAMRHASVSTSAIYDRRDEKTVEKAVAKLHVPFER